MRLKIHVINFVFLSRLFSTTAMIKFVRGVLIINKLYVIKGKKNPRRGGSEWYKEI